MRATIAPQGQKVALMKHRRHTPEQIIRKLREGERLLAEGQELAQIAQHLEVAYVDLAPLAVPVRRDEGQRCPSAYENVSVRTSA